MINLSNNSKIKDGLAPSFNSDLKRFIELIQNNEFSIKLTKKIFDFYKKNNNALENQSIYGFAYWNRFTNEIVIKMETDLYKVRTNLPFGNDLLSHFTVIHFNEFDLKNWLRIMHNSKDSDPISEVAKSLKEKMDSQFEDWYKQLFEATSTNSLLPLEYYYSEFIVTPIDFLSKESQFENYWLELELFSSQNDDTMYSILTLGTSNIPVSKFIFDKDLNLKNPFSYYKDQLIDYVLEKLENTDNLLIMDLNLPLKFLKKILDSETNREEEIVKAIESFKIKILDDFEANHKDQLSENLFDSPEHPYHVENPLDLDDFDDFGIRDIKKKTMSIFIDYLKENGQFPAVYKTVLPRVVYKEAKKQNLIVEVFPVFGKLPLNEIPMVYSPVRSDLSIISLNNYSVSFNLESLNDHLSKTGSKTTKEVKKTVEAILQFHNCRLSDELKSHLNFVLTMETID
ncbi:MAG: hypothetical protein HXM94_00675 [Parvimonas micra]|uniref:Uncharacterized protein n=1 Tax=Parvimonas micra TaxID=33033 RepID=A0A930DZG9_9FIRM|nr:hypothetical protein [Parvimonas micra]MBF1306288.1 hypothetical protein [Parvimonas micra]